MALTWASSVFWAASTTAPWKSRSAARRASGSAQRRSTRRSLASISASWRSVRRPAASRAAVASIVARTSCSSRRSSARRHVGELPRDDVGVEEVPRPPRSDPGAGLRAHLDESLGLQHLDRLAHHGAADTELGGQLVLGRQRRRRPPTGRSTTARPSSSTTRPCNPLRELRGRSSPRPAGHGTTLASSRCRDVASSVPRRAPVVRRDQLGQLAERLMADGAVVGDRAVLQQR